MDLVPVDVILSSGESNGQSTVNLNNPHFILDELRDVVGMTVLQASIPFSYFVFDNLNNQFRIQVTGGTSPPVVDGTYTCTITPGSYNSINLVPQVLKALRESRNLVNAPVDLVAAGFTAFVDVSTSALVLLNENTADGGAFNVNFTGVNSAANIIGFYGGVVGNSVNTSVTPLFNNNETAVAGNYVSSPFSVNLSGENLLMLRSTLASSVYGTVRTHVASSNILQFMTVNNNYQGMIEWVNPNPTERKPMTRNTITQCQFYFTLGFRTRFQAGSVETQFLDFRGQGFQLALRFYQINEARIDYASNALGDRAIRMHSQTGSTMQPHQTRPSSMPIVKGQNQKRARTAPST